MQNLHDADQLLRQHNLAPRAWSVSDPLDYDEEELKTINHLGAGLQDHFESVIPDQLSSTEYDEYQAGEKDAAAYLPRAEQMALTLLKGELRLKASEQCDYYNELRQRGDDQKFCQGVNNAKLFLLKHLPDKRPDSYSRFEVRQLINSGLTSGLKTKTIQRYLFDAKNSVYGSLARTGMSRRSVASLHEIQDSTSGRGRGRSRRI